MIIIVGVIVLGRPYQGFWFKNLLFPPPAEKSSDLVLENENLKAELAQLENIRSELKTAPVASIPAVVFSRYPMNFKEEILVAAGENQGVTTDSAVLFDGVLIGRIEKVFADSSLVLTVFDSRFHVAVRLGSASVDGLFEGGVVPRVSLIPKKSSVEGGAAVYSAAPDLPYGLALGKLGDLKVSDNQLFLEAPVKLPYDLNDIRVVSIARYAR